jgi:hypothetical protein
MTILQANFKHLYQGRIFWLKLLLFGFLTFLIIIMTAKGLAACFPMLIIWMFLFGAVAAETQKDVLTKPFSYCLPRHPEIPRKFLFCTGLAASFLLSIIFLRCPAPDFAGRILTCVSVFSVGTVFYWLGVWFVFRFPIWTYSMAFLVLAIIIGQILNVHTHIIMHYPFSVIAAGAAVNIWAWIHWGRQGLARKYCGRMWIGSFNMWDVEKLYKYHEVRLAENKKDLVSPKIETFFIRRISLAGENLSRYIWGGLYKSMAVMLSGRSCRNSLIGTLIAILPLALFMGYIGRGSNIIFIMPAFMVLPISLHIHSHLMISGGRRERFWTALTLETVTSLHITAFLILMTLITLCLEQIMPALTLNGWNLNFKAFDINLSFVPLVVIPVAFTVGLIFDKKPMMKMIVLMVFFQLIFIFLIIKPANERIVFSPAQVIALLLCSWAIFVSVLRYICIKCNLVK